MNICPHCNTEHESEIVSPAKDELVDRQCFYCGTILTDAQIEALTPPDVTEAEQAQYCFNQDL